MERAEITSKLIEIMKTNSKNSKVDFDKCDESSELQRDLGLNSIGMLYIVIAIEDTFEIELDDANFQDFKTVGNFVDYIEKKIS